MWEFEAIGLPALQNELTGMERAFAAPAAELEKLAPEASADIRGNFLAGGRPMTWPDITAASRAGRKEDAASGPLLDTKALMNAASATEHGADGSLFGIAGDTLTLGTDLVYAATQEFGRGAIPARPYEHLTDTDALRLAGAAESDYLHALLAGSPVL